MKKFKRGYTTGVFDMFHIGHLNIIKKAKEQCEYLIVGVSTDNLVQQYKHKLPIIPYEERLEIVKAIKYVDEVVPQTSLDKLQAWYGLQFDVMFHGSDWKDSAMYNKAVADLKQVGAEVVFLPHTKGISSTLLSEVLQKIQEGQA